MEVHVQPPLLTQRLPTSVDTVTKLDSSTSATLVRAFSWPVPASKTQRCLYLRRCLVSHQEHQGTYLHCV